MKKHFLRILNACIVLPCVLAVPATVTFAETADSYSAIPPFVSRGADPNVLLNLSIETPMQGAAYNDQPNDLNKDGDTNDSGDCSGRINDGGTVGICYKKNQEYLGIFDPNKAYDYSGGVFVPVGSTNADHETSGHWSGNFLNWATMTAIDEFRWALTGGRRVTDSTTATVIERANMTLGKGHDWYPVKMLRSTKNVAPSTVTPYSDTSLYIYNHGYQFDVGTTWGGFEKAQNLNVRVKVCETAQGLEKNCVSYDNGAYYKPEGLIQNNATSMRFAVMAYALDDTETRDGGILRSQMKYVGPLLPDGTANPVKEYDIDGIYIANPDSAAEGNSGVINYVNKFGVNGYKSHDPVGELFYECLNYYKNRGRTPEYADTLTTAQKDGFPVITQWADPIQNWCQPNFIVGINDANPWLDKRLPGTYFTSPTFSGHPLRSSDYGTPGNPDSYNVTDLTNTVGELQGINDTSQCIGCVSGNCDMSANNKIIPGLGEVMGTCPWPGKENSYYVSGLSYYANSQDIRPDLEGRQTISTFMIDTQEYSSNPLVGQMNMLWLTGKYGGFDEKDLLDTNGDGNVYEPNLVEEWDADGDGEPDNYVLATDPKKLINGLAQVFSDISSRSASATAASVISGSRSGKGSVYQSIFYPVLTDNAHNSINWAGSVHATFVDNLGRMREDTNQNRILDDNDSVIVYRHLPDNTLVIDKFALIGSVAERTMISLPAATALAGKYFLLNTPSESLYVWFTVDGSGADPKQFIAALHDLYGIRVDLDESDTAGLVAVKTANILDAFSSFNVPAPTAATITVTNTVAGSCADANAATSGAVVTVTRQGVGETTRLIFTGITDDIDYLWNTDNWLNTITNTDIILQRTYTDPAKKRFILTFIDQNQNDIADANEQLDFITPSLPALSDLYAANKIFPYIPVHSDSESLPPYVSISGGNRDEFLQKQTRRVINYIRGLDNGSETLTTGAGGKIPAFRSRMLDLDHDSVVETTWRLGDIVHSSPTVVSKPQEALHLLYKDASYAAFAQQYRNRRTVLYTGANDGMFHAFNGGFYEDRFDVFPATHDNAPDVEYLLQPKNAAGSTITTGFAAHDLGAELWAYVPYNLLPHLYWLTESNYNARKHVYYTDLKPRIFDAKIFENNADHPGGWGTVLVGGMRFGGGKITVDMNRTDGNVNADDRSMSSAFFILDITNPEIPPVVLGEINFPHLGYTTCYPTVIPVKDKVETANSPNKWYLVFGSGPAESDGSAGAIAGTSLDAAISGQKAELYVVDLVELATNKKLVSLNSSGVLTDGAHAYQTFSSDNNAFISDPITVDYDLDYRADAVYFGTVSYDSASLTPWGGKLRRVVINDSTNSSSWDGDSVLLDLETVAHQPITAAPAAGIGPDGRNWVFFGTGRYIVRDDKDITDQQAFYGIKEPRVANTSQNSYTEVFLASLYNSTPIEIDSTTSLVSGGAWANISWQSFVTGTASSGGWYYNFPDNLERNIGQAALYGDILTFTSYVPSDDVCTFEGSSYLYALYYLTGTAGPDAVLFDPGNPTPANNLKRIDLGRGLVSKPSIHVGKKDGTTVSVQSSDGSILTIDENNTGQTRSGVIGWRYR